MDEILKLPAPKGKRITLDDYFFGDNRVGEKKPEFSIRQPEEFPELFHFENPISKMVEDYAKQLVKEVDSIRRRSIPSGHVELCTVLVQDLPTLPAYPIQIIITKDLAVRLATGEATVEALDPIFVTLRPDIREFVKGIVRTHIDKFKK